MIVCHEYRYIFLKTRKTAGTSLEIALAKFCGPRDILTRISRGDEELRRRLGYRTAQNYWIPLIRYSRSDWRKLIARRFPLRYQNHMPAAKVKSHIAPDIWNSYTKITVERNPWDRAISFYYWYTQPMTPRPSLLDFLTIPKYRNALSNFPIYSIDGSVVVDRLLRYENLDAEVEQLAVQLHLPGRLDLPHAKASVRPESRPYWEIIGPEEQEVIASLCAKEIELLGYAFRAGK